MFEIWVGLLTLLCRLCLYEVKLKLISLKKLYIIIVIGLTCFFRTTLIYSQNKNFDEYYGVNQDLVSGFQYAYAYQQFVGNPFFFNENFVLGEVKIKDKIYSNLALKYDIYHQKVVLKYQNNFGAVQQVELVDSMVNGFSLNHIRFVQVKLEDKGVKYVEVVNQGKLQGGYFWSKELKLHTGSGDAQYHFSNDKSKFYLISDGVGYPIRNKWAFLERFPDQKKKKIKTLIKAFKVRFGTKYSNNMAGFMNELNKMEGLN